MNAEELRNCIRGEVSSDAAELERDSVDASIFKVVPQAVAHPKDTEDIKKLVAFARAKKRSGEHISLTARSAGTDMSGGPLNESVIVDFTKYFTRIQEVGKDYAVVEPGVYYRDFEKATLAKGLLLPSYPASREICTVGGMVANNSGGEKTLAYGKTEDYVQELRAVLADGNEYVLKPLSRQELEGKMQSASFEGEIYRKTFELIEKNYEDIRKAKPNVSKNSAGYFLWNVWDKKTFDLAKLFVGSQGTLGFVTNIRFRLVPMKEYSRLVVMFLKDTGPLTRLVGEVLKFKPESFESFDDNTFKLAMKFLPDIIKRMKGNAFLLGLQFLPELFMVLRGGVPKLILLAEVTSDSEVEAESRAKGLEQAVKQFGIATRLIRRMAEARKYWVMRRESFSLLRQHIRDKHTAPFIDDFIVRPDRLSDFLPRLNAILDPYRGRLIYTIAGHVGDGNFHIIPLMNLKNPQDREIIPKLMEAVNSLVLEFGGSITAEHNDGLIRSPYLKRMYGERVYRLFEEVKRIFDPDNIFNPGKKVGSDIGYAMRHIKT
jgi:FAD/FMN-containing dehydrogenase